MRLYKYRDNSINTNNIFIKKKIWLSNAEGLNDPFECSIQEIANEFITKEVENLKKNQIAGFISVALRSIKLKNNEIFYGMTNKATKEFLKKFKSKSFNEKYETTKQFVFRKTGITISNPEDNFRNFDKQLNEAGIFSLSETDTNQLMWAHYSDKSTGISLGFDIDEKQVNQENLIKVTYSDVLPKFGDERFNIKVTLGLDGKNTQKIAFTDKTFRKAISTKPTCWEYEKEWRYIKEESGLFNFPGKLNEVIFGLNCPKAERIKYLKLIKDNFDYEIEINQIIKIPNTNRIRKIKAGNTV